MFPVYFFLLVLPTISAQITKLGHCPAPYVPPDFNINQFLGTWYEIARIPNSVFPGKCVTGTFSLTDKGDTVIERVTQVIGGQNFSIEARLRITDKSDPGKLEHQLYPGRPFVPFLILHTDYKTYAVLFICKKHTFTHSQYAWIMARSPTLDQTIIDGVLYELTKEGIDADSMKLADQSCFTSQSK